VFSLVYLYGIKKIAGLGFQAMVRGGWHHAVSSSLIITLTFQAGIDLLYGSIVIRRVPAIQALLATLTDNPRLGTFIRKITIMCFVPQNFRATIHPDLTQILNFCPNLLSLNHLPPFPLPKPFPFPSLPSTVTSLKLSIHDNLSAVYGTLQQCCAQLEDLSIHGQDDEMFDAIELSFPRLHTLCVSLNGKLPVQAFSTKWDMPKLQRLTFQVPERSEAFGHDYLRPTYHVLLTMHGRRLKYVAFPPRRVAEADFTPLLANCPVVEHVVLPRDHYIDPSRRFPSIKWVDIWSPGNGKPDLTDDERNCSCYPHIEGPFRFLDTALVPLIDVPRAFDPRVRGNWTLVLPGLSIRQQERDGLIAIQFLDLYASDNWEFSYFGAIQLRAEDREQGELELYSSAYDDLSLVHENPIEYIDSLTNQSRNIWDDLDGCMEDESDGDSEDSWFSLESEDLGDLEDEFYDRL
jgi:hypothetical protein